ncbi:MAG: hypothetical protein ACI4JQ_08700 [Ruminococcus sp.]
MKQKLRFDLGLYLEGLRQLRVSGLIGIIVTAGIAILMLITMEDFDVTGTITYTGLGYIPWLLISFVIFMPLLMLQMFHFMNKRNASDLYHSLPHTRGTLYLSFTSAVVTWILIIIFTACLTALIGAWIRSEQIALVYDTFFLWMLYCISGSILVGGAIMVAKGLSGTLLNSIVLTGLILFLPRFLLSMLIGAIECNPIFDGCIGNRFTSSGINPVTGIVFSLFGVEENLDLSALAISVSTIVYGFVLGLIYFVIGGFLFCRRDSETASQSAPSRRMQAVYRILVAIAMCSVPVMFLFQHNYLYPEAAKEWDTVIISYVVILFVYFLYELLSTRKLKNLVKAIPTLGIVAVLNVAMYFGMAGAYTSAMDFRPAADEINGVTILSDAVIDEGYMSYDNYVLSELGGIRITDQQVLKDVSYSLAQSLKQSKETVNNVYSYGFHTNMRSVLMGIETDAGQILRNVYMSLERYESLNTAICSNQDFKEAWITPPKSDYIETYDFYGLGDDERKQLYKMFCEEAKSADFQTWFDLYLNGGEGDFGFQVSYLTDGKTCYVDVPVYTEIAPKTVECYYEMGEEKQQTMLKEAQNKLNTLKDAGTAIEGNIYVYMYDHENTYFEDNWELTASSAELPFQVLEARADGSVQSGEKMLQVDISIWYMDDTRYEPFSYQFLFPADKTTLEMLKALREEYSDKSDFSDFVDAEVYDEF